MDFGIERPAESTLSKVFKTIFLIFTWICLGLFLEIQGPTFKDLQIRTHGSTEEISRSISMRSVGYFTGAVIGGILVDKLNRFCFLMIGMSLDVAAVATAVAPWSPYIAALWALFFLQGFCEGIINIAGQKLILQIWKEKASSPLHALHLGYGIGSFIIPNIANPFLAIPLTNALSQNGSMNNTVMPYVTEPVSHSTTSDSNLEEITMYAKESQIQWAYLIVAGIVVVVSVSFYVFQLSSANEVVPPTGNKKTTVNKLSFKSGVKIVDPSTCASGNRLYGVQVFILLFLFMFNAFGGERIYGKFIRNFAIDELKFSSDNGSLINTSFWITFSVGRFCGFVGAMFIPIRILILIEVFGTLISGVILNILGYKDKLMLWIFTQPMSLFLAPLIPSGIAWANFHLDMTGLAITFIILGGSLGGMSYMWIIGHFYDIEYRSFLYLSVTCGAVMSVLVIIMTVITRGRTKPETILENTTVEVNSQSKVDYVNRTFQND